MLQKFFLIPSRVSPIPAYACDLLTCCCPSLSRTCTFAPGSNHDLVSPFPLLHKAEQAHWTPLPAYALHPPSQRTFRWTPSCMSAFVLCCEPRITHQEWSHHCWKPVKDLFPLLVQCFATWVHLCLLAKLHPTRIPGNFPQSCCQLDGISIS